MFPRREVTTSFGNTETATGTEILSVFSEPALIRFWSRFSQYNRAADVALLLSQYNVKLSNTSSLVGVCSGSRPYDQSANPGCTSMNAARPAGESVIPYPTACGRALIICTYAMPPFAPYVFSASTTPRSSSDSPAGNGPPPSAAPTSFGTVAGKLVWMPSRPAGA